MLAMFRLFSTAHSSGGMHRNGRRPSSSRSTTSTGVIRRGKRRAVSDEQHRRAMVIRGYGLPDRIPGHTVERGIADRLQAGPEAVLILPQRLIAHRPPSVVAAEFRPD
jgi:hypothetical protein